MGNLNGRRPRITRDDGHICVTRSVAATSWLARARALPLRDATFVTLM
jgi:hypothetical protein